MANAKREFPRRPSPGQTAAHASVSDERRGRASSRKNQALAVRVRLRPNACYRARIRLASFRFFSTTVACYLEGKTTDFVHVKNCGFFLNVIFNSRAFVGRRKWRTNHRRETSVSNILIFFLISPRYLFFSSLNYFIKPTIAWHFSHFTRIPISIVFYARTTVSI